ncbi:YlbL family protein [Schaalia sp. ZJ405]|uniref:YlbL family protein n=1 Tax=Schaalia sp. ZJ405 TaxID=2709403 RepID=UPI001E4B9A98|nr:S16 family serine protease [Schaalia sp. ZJ405]
MRDKDSNQQASGTHTGVSSSRVPSSGNEDEGENSASRARGRFRHLLRVKIVIGTLVGVIAGAVLFIVPMPYVVHMPGPTFNVIGSLDGSPFINITGTDPTTHKAVSLDHTDEKGDGELRMVTVSESGGPGHRLTLAELIGAKLDSRNEIRKYSEVYAPTTTQKQVEERAKAAMESSQSTSEVAALEQLGWSIPAVVTVAGVVPGADAKGKVVEGDILRSITTADGVVHSIESISDPFAIMREIPVNSTVTLTVERSGETKSLDIVTGKAGEDERGSKLGIYLVPKMKLPVNITFNLEQVGGPSAGLMFSLGIIDRLTPGPLTGGAVVAGTGTMSYDGEVGAIGGIRQKMWGAVNDGATWFLAPASNCDEVVGHIPEGLNVVKVSTLEDALNAVNAIKEGKTQSLPTCQAG